MTMPNGRSPHPMPAPAQPQPQPGFELVQPVPMSVAIWGKDTPQGPVVAVRIACALGPLHFYFTTDEAIEIGNQLRHLGKAGKTGLTLPPGVRLDSDTDDEPPAAPPTTGPTIETT